MRLQPNREECFEFCIRSFEFSERNFQDVIKSGTYAAAFLKKQITAMPSNAGLQYARLYDAYTTQLSHLRHMKRLIATGRRIGWRTVIPMMRKLLTGLPLSGTNLALLSTKLQEIYPKPNARVDTQPAVRDEQGLVESAEPNRPDELHQVLTRVRSRKQHIGEHFEAQKMEIMDAPATDAQRENHLRALQQQCDGELAICDQEESVLLASIEAQESARSIGHRGEQLRETEAWELAGVKSELAQAEDLVRFEAGRRLEAEHRAQKEGERVRELEEQVAQLQQQLTHAPGPL